MLCARHFKYRAVKADQVNGIYAQKWTPFFFEAVYYIWMGMGSFQSAIESLFLELLPSLNQRLKTFAVVECCYLILGVGPRSAKIVCSIF